MTARRRVGVVVPSANSTVEPDFVLAAPKQVTVHANRIGWEAKNLNEDEAIVDRMNAGVTEAARNLAAARVEVIAYAFATGSFYRGLDYASQLVEQIESATGVPAVATSPAMVEALRALGARRLTVTSPYPEWNNQQLRAYLEAAGFRILNIAGERLPPADSLRCRTRDLRTLWSSVPASAVQRLTRFLSLAPCGGRSRLPTSWSAGSGSPS